MEVPEAATRNPWLFCAAALAVLIGGSQLCACSAPVIYPRSAELLDAEHGRLRVSGNYLALAPTSAEVELEPGEPETVSDLSAARVRNEAWMASDWVLGPFLSVEGGADISLGLCEAGGLLSFLRIGVELRCGVLQEDWGAPFSLALSGAYLYPIDISDQYPSKHRHGFRTGIDSSVRFGRLGPLLGAYVDHAVQPRELVDTDLPEQRGEILTYSGEVRALRDEWRLSVPLGVVLYGKRHNLALAVAPEYTFSARDLQAPVANLWDGAGNPVRSFEQRWAVFLTVNGALTF